MAELGAEMERERNERNILIDEAIMGFREKPGTREMPRNPQG